MLVIGDEQYSLVFSLECRTCDAISLIWKPVMWNLEGRFGLVIR